MHHLSDFSTLPSEAPPRMKRHAPAPPKDDILARYARLLIESDLPDELQIPSESFSAQSTNGWVPIRKSGSAQAQVGILGAGVGGLYAAMILKSLEIPFEILEARDRTGGRLYTHHFVEKDASGKPLPKQKKHDYYVSSV